MDSVSRESIANALQAYQDTVLAQNLAMLKILVNAAEHGLDHTTEYTDEESLELQLRLFDSQYGLIGPDTGVTALQDVLNGDLLQDIIEVRMVLPTERSPLDLCDFRSVASMVSITSPLKPHSEDNGSRKCTR